MSDWGRLLAELDEHEPSFALIQEVRDRASWRSSSPEAPRGWRGRIKLGVAVAFGAVVVACVLLVLALAAHSRTSVRPGHPAPVERPPVTTVRLDVRNGQVDVFGYLDGIRQASQGGLGGYTVHCRDCGLVGSADWSGDGALLAYSASCSFAGCGMTVPSHGIRVFDAQSRTDRLVVSGEHLGPVSVSADGTWIVYADTHMLRVVPTDGSLPARTIVTSPLDVVTTPTWSPDGKWIAYVSGDRVYTASADGRNRAPLVRGHVAAWSPNGRWIAYLRGGLRLVAPDGTGDHPLATPELASALKSDVNYTNVEWSPDGRRLALVLGDRVAIISARTGAVMQWLSLSHSGGMSSPSGLAWRPAP